MKKQSAAALRRKRKRLLARLPPLGAILRGSLIERYKPCGKPGCRCHQKGHPGHGPKYYLSVTHTDRRPQMDYVPQEYLEQAERYLANYRKVREILNEVCAINTELLRRREQL